MLFTFKKGGIHPPENKLSSKSPIQQAPIPETVAVCLSQHIGAPATPVVKAREQVKVGQLIAQAKGLISANVHAPVSGTVTKIDKLPDTSGNRVPHILIKTAEDQWLEDIDRSTELVREVTMDAEAIKAKIQEMGIVGLGGATFPTNVKLSPPSNFTAKVLIVNGVECEPYLTADERLMLEKTEEIFIGVEILKKALGVEQAIIGIENNKPEAIACMRKFEKSYQTKVIALKVKYPQGAEKQLIKASIKKEIKPGQLPISVGAVVQNVGTVFAVYEAVQKNKPLVERVVTVTGKEIAKPGNFMARIGTSYAALLELCGGLPESTNKLVSGGPMMGKAVANTDLPVMKGTSGILAIDAGQAQKHAYKNCIRCTQCVNVCPMGLEPYFLMNLSEHRMVDELKSYATMDCVECGSCSYICPSERPLLDYIRLGKSRIRKQA